MKLTESKLKRLIEEELTKVIKEGQRDWDLEDNVSYFITSGPAEKAAEYLSGLIAHHEKGGEVSWEAALNTRDPKMATVEYAQERLSQIKAGKGIGRTE